MQINIFNNISHLDKLMFTKHMYIMLKSGVPIYEALGTLAESTKSKPLKKVIGKIISDIQNGKSFYDALIKHPTVFDGFFTSLIKISEESGTLEETLLFLSDQMEKDYQIRQKIKGAMFYPMLIVVAGGGVAAFISIAILPQLVDFFGALEIELPLPTKILLFFANIMKDHGILIFAGLFLFFIGIKLLINTKFVRPHWDAFVLKIPLFGKVVKYGNLARFCRNFGTLLKSGVPAAKGLNTTADALSNLVFQKHLHEVQESLEKGKNISDSLAKKKYDEFPTMVVTMIRIGERTGNLEEVLIYMSEFYEDEIDNITKSLTTVLEPILLLAMGIMVGFIAIAIIGPIYKLTGSIN